MPVIWPPFVEGLLMLFPELVVLLAPHFGQFGILPCANACCTKLIAKKDATSRTETTIADSTVSCLLNIRPTNFVLDLKVCNLYSKSKFEYLNTEFFYNIVKLFFLKDVCNIF